ncbi:MAG: DUF6261 family protein [Bacteroidota bacterium]|nr:DUF6261 family protein [Bacteroidota bacterium]
MEQIKDFSLHSLQNEEHYKFQCDFDGLVQLYTPATLRIEAAYNLYKPVFEGEGEALNLVRKSSYTQSLSDADGVRDTTVDGLEDAIKSGLKHFNPAVREAANRLKILLDSHGDIVRKSYDKETADITKLISELRGNYAADVATLGITDWVNELERNNNNFVEVQNSRYDEQGNKTRLRMKSVRKEVDAAYNTIIKRINSMILLKDDLGIDFDFGPFVSKLNQRIDNYVNNMARRSGRNQTSDEPSEDGKQG